MNLKQVLITLGIAVAAGTGGYTINSDDLDRQIAGLQTVTDSLVPAHMENYYRDTTVEDSTLAILDSVLVPAAWAPISIRVNDNKTFRAGDSIIFMGIEKQSGQVATNGVLYVVGDSVGDVSYIAKFDRYRK